MSPVHELSYQAGSVFLPAPTIWKFHFAECPIINFLQNALKDSIFVKGVHLQNSQIHKHIHCTKMKKIVAQTTKWNFQIVGSCRKTEPAWAEISSRSSKKPSKRFMNQIWGFSAQCVIPCALLSSSFFSLSCMSPVHELSYQAGSVFLRAPTIWQFHFVVRATIFFMVVQTR